MQRHKAGSRITPGGSSNPAPSPAWQQQDSGYSGIKLYTPNEHLQSNADMGRLAYPQQGGLPNVPQPDLTSQMGAPAQAQHWDWTNGTAQLNASHNTWEWGHAAQMQQPQQMANRNVLQQYSQQPQQGRMTSYEHSSPPMAQPQQHTNWDVNQHQPQPGTVHRSFSDVWNWGGESDTPGNSDSTPPAMGQQASMDMSQQYRQVPDGQDQGGSQYPNWNQNQQVQYDWSQTPQQQLPQGYQNSSLAQPLPSWDYSAPSAAYSTADSNNLPGYDLTDAQPDEVRPDLEVRPTVDVSNDVFQPDVQASVSETYLNSAHENLLPDLTAHCADEENVTCPKLIENSCEGTVATFFQYGQEDEEEVEERDKEVQNKDPLTNDLSVSHPEVEKDLAKEEMKQDSPPELESLGPNPVWGRAPYLRCDSWFSNSSLMTYNPSTTGSQELISGSFFGEEGPTSMGSISGLCQSVDDMHLSSTQSLPYPSHYHPHQLRPMQQTLGSRGLRRRRSSVEEQILSLPLPPTEKVDIIPVTNEARRASLPIAVLPNQEVVTESLAAATSCEDSKDPTDALNGFHDNLDLVPQDVKLNDQIQIDGIQEAGFNQEMATNLEVPPNSTEAPPIAAKNGSQQPSVPLTENIEVVQSKCRNSEPQPSNGTATVGNYKLPGWSREGSAFQPPLPSRSTNVTPVIQREAPDQPHGESSARSANLADMPSEILKTEPESANLETVPDNVERPLDTDGVEVVKKSSPNRSPLHSSYARQHLRDVQNSSPATSLWENPELTQDFGVKLAPAVLSATSQPSQQQGVLVVPQLGNLLDNPLGVSQPIPNASKHKTATAPSKTAISDMSELPNQRVPNLSKDSRETPAPVGASPPAASPLDLSSRAAPQGRSAADEDNVRNVQPRAPAAATQVNPGPPFPPLQSIRPEEGDRRHYVADHAPNELERDSVPLSRSNAGDDGGRVWSDRRRYSVDRDDDYEQRSRRRDYIPPDPRDDRGQTWNYRDRDYDRDRERPPFNDPYYQPRYDAVPERDRSRPSSRSSAQDFDSNRRDRHYEMGGGRYPTQDDPRRPLEPPRPPLEPPRPSSRGGYESDQGSGRYGQSGYDAWDDYYQRDPRDPRYSAYHADYYRLPRDRYDPRYSQQHQQHQQHQQPYYGASQYNYGYYAELYGSDPRYRAYYDAMAKSYYYQYGNQYGYDDFDRRSVHSGRSSVTDDSQKGSERFSNTFHQENRPLESNQPINELSSIYPQQDSSYYPQSVELSNDYPEHVPLGSESVSTSPPQRLTPAKFSTPHLRATFSPCGQLVVLPPNSIMDGQIPTVEVCDVHAVLASDPVAQELNSFPSPLIRGETHKNDVIQYCQQKARKAKEDVDLPDRSSCVLIWELLMLLIRQNGVVVGTDIAELLLQDQKLSPISEAQLSEKSDIIIDDGAVVSENRNSINCQVATSQGNDKFIEFLLFGHKKDALEWAMKQGLWGHALFLASKMESRTYAMVMTRFANSLAFNDPLQTLYQLMSGRQPAAVTAIADERWGDWRPHLAIILSNSTQRPELDRRSVVTLGDTLAAHGCLHAAHFCYLMAQMDFGSFDKKPSKLVLIGSNHNLPFSEFATTEAIKCTEVYEYVQSLANPNFVLSHLQFYKFIYATRLAEFGHPQEALHYCEVITQVIQKMPALYDYELVHQLYELAYRLKYYDPYYTQEEGEVADLGDPLWLRQLLAVLQACTDGSVLPVTEYTEQPTTDSVPNISQSYIDPVSQDPGTFGTLHTNSSYQTQTSYSGQDQVSSYAPSTQLNYADNSQQPAVYPEYQNQSIPAVDGSVGQQQPYENYYGQNGSSVAGEYGQNVMQSPYSDYYGMSPGTSNGTQEYSSDAQDGQLAPSQTANNDYYDISTRKNSVPSSPTLTTAPSLKSAQPGEQSMPRKNSGSRAPSEKPKSKKGNGKGKPKQGGSWLGGIFSKFSLKPQNQMILPDDKNPTLVWDANDKKWINTDGDEEDESVGPIAPPKDLELSPSPRPATLGAPSPAKGNLPPAATAPPAENRFKLRQGRVGMRQNYVDVLGGNTVPVISNAMPMELFPNQGTQQATPQFFIPAPVVGSDMTLMDFVTTGQPANHIGNPGSRGGSPQQNFDEDDSSQRSRSSSQSSLSREVQSYLPGHHATSKNEINQGHQQQQQQPLMFNPSQIGGAGPQGGAVSTQAGPRGGLHRYGRYPR